MTSNQTDQELLSAIDKIFPDCGEVDCDTCGARHSQVLALIKADRQKMIEKLSFHLGIDKKTLEGYLQAKDKS